MEFPEIDKLWKELKRYAFYEDYKELYQKTVIPVQKFEEVILDHSKEHRQMKIMIKTFDENLALKSNKKDIWKIENDLRVYATKQDLAKLEEDTDEEVLKLK